MPRKRNDGDISAYIKEQVLAEYAISQNIAQAARKYEMNYKTAYKIVHEMKDDYNEIREVKKQEMVVEIWDNLKDAQKLGHKYIKEALEGARDIPLNHVSNYFGTMYDRQALMAGDNTQNIGGEGIQVVFSMPDVAEDEEQWKQKTETSD